MPIWTASNPQLTGSVEVPFSGTPNLYWAQPTDRSELSGRTYLERFGGFAKGLGVGVAAAFAPAAFGKHPGTFWFKKARWLEEFASPYGILSTFRVGEALSASLKHTSPYDINLRNLSGMQRMASASYMRNIMGVTNFDISTLQALRFKPGPNGVTGKWFGVGFTGQESFLTKGRSMRPGRLFESFTSVAQPGLHKNVMSSRAIMGGIENTRMVPVPTKGTLVDFFTGVRSYAAFGAQRLGELMERVGDEIKIPGTNYSLKSLIERVGLRTSVARGPAVRTLFSYAKMATAVGLGIGAIQQIDAFRASGSLFTRSVGVGLTGFAGWTIGRAVARGSGMSMAKGGKVGLGIAAASQLLGFQHGIIPGLASIPSTANLLRSSFGEMTGLNALRRWTEKTFPGSTGLGPSLYMGLLGGVGAYAYARHAVPGDKMPPLFRRMFMDQGSIYAYARQRQLQQFGEAVAPRLQKAVGNISPVYRERLSGVMDDMLKDNAPLFSGTADVQQRPNLFSTTERYEAANVARRVQGEIHKKYANAITSGGLLQRGWQRLYVGAKLGRLSAIAAPALFMAGLWSLPSLGTMESPEELKRIYSGEQLVPVRRGRRWEMGRSPYEGGDILFWRQHHLPRLRAAARVRGRDPYTIPFLKENFGYDYERENYYTRPAPITGAFGDEIPFVSGLIRPLGDLIKPPRLMHVNEWARINEEGDLELRYHDTSLTPSPSQELGGLPPAAPVSPYSLRQQLQRQFYETTELMGLVGWTAQSFYTGLTGAQFPFDEDLVMHSGTQIESMRRRFWGEHMGGALFGVPLMSEAVRRFLPAYPSIFQSYNPIENQLADFLPRDFRIGDPMTTLLYGAGTERLPGPMYEELYGVEDGQYGLPHRLRVLADIGYWSKEFRATRNEAQQYLRLFDDSAKYKYFYKTTNLATGGEYYGVHTTNTLDDDYVGSGTGIREAKKRWGPMALHREILKFFPTTQAMYSYEKDFVDEDLLQQPGIMNRAPGGSGFANIDPRTARDMRQTLSNLQLKKEKIPLDYYRTMSSGYGFYDAQGNLHDVNEQVRARGLIASTAGRGWEKFIHGMGQLTSPIEHIMPAGASPWAKLASQYDPVEHYEMNQVYGQQYKFWSHPWQNWFRPAYTSMKRYWLGDKDIPDHIQEVRDTQEYYDKLKWLKYQRLSIAARAEGRSGLASQYKRVAGSSAFGANPFGGESQLKYALNYSDRGYFDAFSMAQTDEARSDIMQMIPHQHRAIYQGIWANRLYKALKRQQAHGAIDASGQETMAEIEAMRAREGRPYTKDLWASYVDKAPQGIGYADWFRMKEAEVFFATHPLPGPAWIGWCIPHDQTIIGHQCEPLEAQETLKNDTMYQGIESNVIKHVFTREVDESIVSLTVGSDTFHSMRATEDHLVLAVKPETCSYKRVIGYHKDANDRCVPRENLICVKCTQRQQVFEPTFIPIKDIKVNDYLASVRMKFLDEEKVIDLVDINLDHPRLQYNDSHVWTYYAKPKYAVERYLKITPDICWLLGYYAAEGHIMFRNEQPRAICFTQAQSEDRFLGILVDILKSLDMPYFISNRDRDIGCSRLIQVNSPIFAQFINQYVPGKCYDKHLANLSVLTSNQHAEAFIAGLYAGDGGKTEKARSVLSVTSYQLALQAKEILAGLGIRHSFRSQESDVRRRKYITTLFYDSNTNQLEKAIRGFVAEYMPARTNLSCFFTQNHVLYKVNSTGQIPYQGVVYDFAVANLHEYRCPIGTYHNSPQVDLQDVMLKQVMEEGKDFHDYDQFQSRVNVLNRKPYLEDNWQPVEQEYQNRLDNQMNTTQYNRFIRGLLASRGLINQTQMNYGFLSPNRSSAAININANVDTSVPLGYLLQ